MRHATPFGKQDLHILLTLCCSERRRISHWLGQPKAGCRSVAYIMQSREFPLAEVDDLYGQDVEKPLEMISEFHDRMEREGRWGDMPSPRARRIPTLACCMHHDSTTPAPCIPTCVACEASTCVPCGAGARLTLFSRRQQ